MVRYARFLTALVVALSIASILAADGPPWP
jgi:hypothetical protein